LIISSVTPVGCRPLLNGNVWSVGCQPSNKSHYASSHCCGSSASCCGSSCCRSGMTCCGSKCLFISTYRTIITSCSFQLLHLEWEVWKWSLFQPGKYNIIQPIVSILSSLLAAAVSTFIIDWYLS
jgi:hypothetical protein